jgi:PGF-CTERM protein
MNAKKIMGAVLVALLALAVFAGAGAAATVFVYQTGAYAYNGDWISDNGHVVISDGQVIPVGTFAPGIYENANGSKLSIVYPTATITGVAGKGAATYNFIGATLYESEKTVRIKAVSPSTVTASKYLLTFANGTTLVYDSASYISNTVAALPKGTYKLAVNFSTSNFVEGTHVNLLETAPVTFTVADAEDVTIAASVDQMIKGETFTITVTGQPGIEYSVRAAEKAFIVSTKQPGLGAIDSKNNNFTFVNFTMPNTATFSFTMAANALTSGDKQDIMLWYYNGSKYVDTKEKLTVKFTKGTISAKTDAASYFVGDVVTISGTTSVGNIVSYKISGTNFYYTGTAFNAKYVECGSEAVKTFEFDIDTKDVMDDNKKLDVGIYTITLVSASGVEAVVPLTVKQPFISIIEAPEVIVQGEDEVQFIIKAEATTKIGYYIFGTNYFACSPATTGITDRVEDEDGEPIANQFIIKLNDTQTKAMAAGQYFAVFQHPMYDTVFAINGYDNWSIIGNGNTINVKERQTANAAQALCDALDAQNIDDMYVKYSFFVVGEGEAAYSISEIPTTIAQGETLTISGVATEYDGDTVTVEMVSTAFAAVPKETVGSAAFIVVTTQIADDGSWEVTLDASSLNVDEYSLNVACCEETWKNVKINVVAAADEPVDPEQPKESGQDEPEEPVAPATPGFGALAALAGLGAAAVLLLRRE